MIFRSDIQVQVKVSHLVTNQRIDGKSKGFHMTSGGTPLSALHRGTWIFRSSSFKVFGHHHHHHLLCWLHQFTSKNQLAISSKCIIASSSAQRSVSSTALHAQQTFKSSLQEAWSTIANPLQPHLYTMTYKSSTPNCWRRQVICMCLCVQLYFWNLTM